MIDRVIPFQASTATSGSLSSSPSASTADRRSALDGAPDAMQRDAIQRDASRSDATRQVRGNSRPPPPPPQGDDEPSSTTEFKELVLEADSVVLDAAPAASRPIHSEPFIVTEADRDLPPGSYVDIFV